jgi:hypothetical protein
MKHILFSLFVLTFSQATIAFDVKMQVQVRDGKKLRVEERTLENLEVENQFDGKYFKIVKGMDIKAVSFDDDPQVVFRAATVYFHLSKARKYFKEIKMDVDFNNLDEKIVIRVDQKHEYSPDNHYKKKEQYNGASSIGKSGKLASSEWGREIWFNKAKKIKRKSSLNAVGNYVDSRAFKNALLGQMLLQDLITFSNDWLVKGSNFTNLDGQSHLYSMALTIGLVELLPKGIGLFGKYVKQKYYLDTALIPEIIYHEYSHQALEPYLELRKVTAITEGYPNYFASKISGLKKLAAKAGKHSKGDRAKKMINKIMYSMPLEYSKQAAFGSFFFGLIHSLEQKMGKQGFTVVVNALKYLDSRSSIKADFYDAIYKSIDDISTSNSNNTSLKIRVNSVMRERGLIRG